MTTSVPGKEFEVEMTSGISFSFCINRKSASFLDFDSGVELSAGCGKESFVYILSIALKLASLILEIGNSIALGWHECQ